MPTTASSDLFSRSLDDLLAHEWLATNGLGGYASSTATGCNTRKYHGLLVAAMSPPVRQMVLLSRVEETVFYDGWPHALATNEYPETVNPQGYRLLRAFSSDPFPRWAYQHDGWTLEKQLRLIPGQNTVVLSYTLLGSAKAVEFELRPLFALRGFHELMFQWNGNLMPRPVGQKPGAGGDAVLNATHLHIPATHRTPEVFFAHDGKYQPEPHWYLNTIYRREPERGYSGLEDLWAPAVIRYKLSPGQTVHFACSTDPIDLQRAIALAHGEPERARPIAGGAVAVDPDMTALVGAASQFVVRGRDGRPMIAAGYPWAAPSGRDAMIALPGLMLTTGRQAEARVLLESFAGMMSRGLMPGDFPPDGSAARYGAADTSLWFVNAVREYLRYTGDEKTARALFDVVDEILTTLYRGAPLGIRADHDGLLVAGSPTTAVTWMNAQVMDQPVTPRYGRPVEVNALWYNALRIGAELARRFQLTVRAEELFTLANRARHAFNAAFWNGPRGCCFDVVGDGGNDAAMRPNQILAVGLTYPILLPERQAQVLDRVRDELLTPYGLRTLSPRESNYHGRYGGPPMARDNAHHQGPAFPWLLGPFVSAMARVYGRSPAVRREAADMLRPSLDYIAGRGMGQLPELFDGESPHQPGGLTASARSVGEVLRVYSEFVLDLGPAAELSRGTTETAARPDEALPL